MLLDGSDWAVSMVRLIVLYGRHDQLGRCMHFDAWTPDYKTLCGFIIWLQEMMGDKKCLINLL